MNNSDPTLQPRTDARCIQWFLGELPQLTSSGILPPSIAEVLRHHYDSQSQDDSKSTLRLVPLVCALLGSALIGCGIILLIAHNWDDLSRTARACLSFAPLILSIAVSGFALWRHFTSTAWREGAALFQTLAIGASISLVSQTYNISGDFPSFMLTWLLLSLPVIYLLRSTGTAVLYVVGATVRMGSCADDWHSSTALAPNWLLLLLALPHLFLLIRHRQKTAAAWLLWALVACLPIFLGFETDQTKHHLWLFAYSGLFATFYLLSNLPSFSNKSLWLNPLKIGSTLGIGIFSLILTYKDTWSCIHPDKDSLIWTPDSLICLLFPLAAIGLSLFLLLSKGHRFNFLAGLFPLLVSLAWLAAEKAHPGTGLLLLNGYVLLLAVSILIGGFRNDRLLHVNAGMILLAALIISRFFDSELGFVIRGVADILVGIGFLTVNYLFLKQRKTSSS